MIDNDYRLPSYLLASDHLSIPKVNGVNDSEVSKLLERSTGEAAIDLHLPTPSTPVTANGKTNGEIDRQRGNVNGHERWIETPKAEGPPPEGVYPVLAIDCEMVRRRLGLKAADHFHQVVSEDGQELARVSVVDFQSGVNVFDELVKPPKPVIDYLTRFVRASKTSRLLTSCQVVGYHPCKALHRDSYPSIRPRSPILRSLPAHYPSHHSPRPFARVRPRGPSNPTSVLHRHCHRVFTPPGTTIQTWAEVVGAKMAW